MAIDRLPSGSSRARLTIDGQRYSARLPSEAGARVWEAETRAAAAVCRGAASETFASYTGWLADFLDDAPDRARFEAALEHRLLPVLGSLPLLEVLEADRNEVSHRLIRAGVDMDDRSVWDRLREVIEDAAADLRVGTFDVGVPVGVG